jgi:hypothetical protein
MLRQRWNNTSLFALFVILQILPQAWPKRIARHLPSTEGCPVSPGDDNHLRMERLIHDIDEARSRAKNKLASRQSRGVDKS